MLPDLTTAAKDLLKREFGVADAEITWKRPERAEHGDLATPVALQYAKKINTSPRVIADALAVALSSVSAVQKAEVAGAGYVNIWLTPAALLSALETTLQSLAPKKPRKKDPPVIVEYSSPNMAKPLGIHHILTTCIGQVIANLYAHQGSSVIRWNYIADWGTQFGQLAVGFQKWGTKPIEQYELDELLALYVRFHSEAEKDPGLLQEARDMFKKIEGGDATLLQFLDHITTITMQKNNEVYRRLQVSFDLELGERFYEDKMAAVIEEGKEKGIFKEGEGGSIIAEFSEESNLPPYLIQKSDGTTLYSTRDLAQMTYRIETYHPQKILFVVDIAQKLHFEQLFATCEQLGWDIAPAEHVIFGRMRFADRSMSTRKGQIIKLEDVVNEAVQRAAAVIRERGDAIQTDDPAELAEMMGVGALVYGILCQNRKMDIVFDWDRMLSFEGNSAPYLQYTHARARSVLRKAEKDIRPPQQIDALESPERVVLNRLLEFPAVLDEARETHMPHILTNYLFTLCQEYNTFYNQQPILQADEPARTLRLSLTSSTASVLKAGAEILTIRVPDRM